LTEPGESASLASAHEALSRAFRVSAATATRRSPVSQVPAVAIASQAHLWASTRSSLTSNALFLKEKFDIPLPLNPAINHQILYEISHDLLDTIMMKLFYLKNFVLKTFKTIPLPK
jgi:hypothetical protein